MIVRADNGGLGNQTWEIWRHLRPEKTLVLLSSNERGKDDFDRYLNRDDGEVTIYRGLCPSVHVLQRLARDCHKVFTVETPYRVGGFDAIRTQGALSVCLANPELWSPSEYGQPDILRLPTSWLQRRVGGAAVLPQPVALDRFPVPNTRANNRLTFYHPTAPAMLDRNGTKIVAEALRHVEIPCIVYVRAPVTYPWPVINNPVVEIRYLAPDPGPYWEQYPTDADVLLLPRRYGGLSLSMLETAALGMPAIVSDLSPQDEYPHVVTVPVRDCHAARMKGGGVPVCDVDPKALALGMDLLSRHPDQVEQLSTQALQWAKDNSWDELLPVWSGTLS